MIMSEPIYACTNCGDQVARDELTSKKVMFSGLGVSATVFRSRTVDWLCDECLGADAQYNSPKDVSRNERMKVAAEARRRNAHKDQ